MDTASGDPLIGFTKLCTITDNYTTDLQKIIKADNISEIILYLKNAILASGSGYQAAFYNNQGLEVARLYICEDLKSDFSGSCMLKFIPCSISTYSDGSKRLWFQQNNVSSFKSYINFGRECTRANIKLFSGTVEIYAKTFD